MHGFDFKCGSKCQAGNRQTVMADDVTYRIGVVRKISEKRRNQDRNF